jgi:hypothetical protein
VSVPPCLRAFRRAFGRRCAFGTGAKSEASSPRRLDRYGTRPMSAMPPGVPTAPPARRRHGFPRILRDGDSLQDGTCILLRFLHPTEIPLDTEGWRFLGLWRLRASISAGSPLRRDCAACVSVSRLRCRGQCVSVSRSARRCLRVSATASVSRSVFSDDSDSACDCTPVCQRHGFPTTLPRPWPSGCPAGDSRRLRSLGLDSRLPSLPLGPFKTQDSS